MHKLSPTLLLTFRDLQQRRLVKVKYAEHLSRCHFSNSAAVVWPRLSWGILKKLKVLVHCDQAIIFKQDSCRRILSSCFHSFAICGFISCQQVKGVMQFLSFLYDNLCEISLRWILMALKRQHLEEIILALVEACTSRIVLCLKLQLKKKKRSENSILWFLKVIKCT